MKGTYGRNLIKIKLGLYVRQQPRNKWRSEVIREPLHVGGAISSTIISTAKELFALLRSPKS